MSALEATSPAISRVNLKNIRRDGGTQPRAGIDQNTLAEYTESMQAMLAESESGERLGLMAALRGEVTE